MWEVKVRFRDGTGFAKIVKSWDDVMRIINNLFLLDKFFEVTVTRVTGGC